MVHVPDHSKRVLILKQVPLFRDIKIRRHIVLFLNLSLLRLFLVYVKKIKTNDTFKHFFFIEQVLILRRRPKKPWKKQL